MGAVKTWTEQSEGCWLGWLLAGLFVLGCKAPAAAEVPVAVIVPAKAATASATGKAADARPEATAEVAVPGPPGTAATPPRDKRPPSHVKRTPVYKLPEPEQGLTYLERYLTRSPEQLHRLASLRKSSSGQESVPFIVDSSVKRLWAVVEGEKGLTPRLLDGAGKDVAVAESTTGRSVFSLDKPKAGAWRLELEGGQGTPVVVAVYATTDLSVHASPDRTGTTPKRTLPLIGRPWVKEKIRLRSEPWMRGSRQANFSRIRFGVIKAEGKPRWLKTTKVPVGRGSHAVWLTDEMTLQADERVIVEGELISGEHFQRDAPSLTPSHFLISPELSGSLRERVRESGVTPSSWTRILVDVTRGGSSGNVVMGVKLKPQDLAKVEARIDPLTFELKDGATRRVAVFFRAKPRVGERRREWRFSRSLLTVGGSADDPLGNSVPVELALRKDSDGDGVADDTEQQRGRDQDNDRDGIPDFRQREVITFGHGRFSLRLSPAVTLSTIERLHLKDSELPPNTAPLPDVWRLRLADDTTTLPTHLQLFDAYGSHAFVNALYVQTATGAPWLKRSDYDAEAGSFFFRLSREEAHALGAGTFAIALVRER